MTTQDHTAALRTLRAHIGKASFATGADRHTALECLSELEKALAQPEQPAPEAVAYLHTVTNDDGERDQALSFAPDNFPLKGVGGFRSVGVQPLYDKPQQPAGWKLVPIDPTPEILATASLAAWPTASAADINLARQAARIVLMQMDAAPGSTLETIAAAIATMGPAYRAMVNAAPAHPSQQEDDVRDAARLDWMVDEECVVQGYHGGIGYRIYWPVLKEWQSEFFPTPRAAIDAAMAAAQDAVRGGGNG